jgi:hypothetical protein
MAEFLAFLRQKANSRGTKSPVLYAELPLGKGLQGFHSGLESDADAAWTVEIAKVRRSIARSHALLEVGTLHRKSHFIIRTLYRSPSLPRSVCHISDITF